MGNIFRALSKEDVEVRVQSTNDKGIVLLIYKNARVDQNILDETFGPFGWQNKYEEYKGNLYCSIGIKDNLSGEWIWKSNCGTESNTEKEKGEASDAFKRAAFNWGIGRELYTSPKTKVKGHVTLNSKKGTYEAEFYEYDVTVLEVSEEPIRHISALTIIGKSMEGGYHEETVFEWAEKKGTRPASAPTTPKDEKKDIEMGLDEARSMVTSRGTPLYKLDADRLKFIIDNSKQPRLVKAAEMVLDDRLAEAADEIFDADDILGSLPN